MGADFETTFQSIHDKLVAHPVPVQYPIGQDSTFKGIIDLVTMKADLSTSRKNSAPALRKEKFPTNLKQTGARLAFEAA